MARNNQQNNQNNNFAAMLTLLILFWPVGLYMLFQKLSNDKTATFTTYKFISVMGWLMMLIAAMMIAGSIAILEPVAIVFFSYLFIGGIVLTVKASKMKSRAGRYRQYINIAANKHITSIEHIANVTQTDYDEVVADLKEMVKAGYFKNGYVDLGTRQLVLPQMLAADPFGAAYAYAGPSVPAGPRNVSCPCCGANNTIMPNAPAVCDYCGSRL